MKDKAIFILSLILVVVGVTYLGYTSYQFFTRKTTGDATQNEKSQSETPKTSVYDLSIEGSSNKELLGENLVNGDSVNLKADIKNNSTDRVSTNLEGRVYKITDLYTFPDVDKDIPVNIETIPVAINGGETSLYSYKFITSGCGNFYMALASADFWTEGFEAFFSEPESVLVFSINFKDTNNTIISSITRIMIRLLSFFLLKLCPTIVSPRIE